nr:transcription repressor KAN1-like isoform X2 [Ipomoea batatas]
MPLEGVFIEPSRSNPLPDLSLHISPPNNNTISSSPSSCINELVAAAAGFDLPTTHHRHRQTDNNNNSTSAAAASSQQVYPELSLANPTSTAAADEVVREAENRFLRTGGREQPYPPPYHLGTHTFQNNGSNNNNSSSCSQMSNINHGVSLLDVSDGLRPIKGIPVYQNRSFPFLPTMDHHHHGSRENKDPSKMLMDQRGAADGSSSQLEQDFPNSTTTTLWSNSSSSRKGWLQTNSSQESNGLIRSSSFPTQQRCGHPIDDCEKNPSLEFTLGRPDWVQKERD